GRQSWPSELPSSSATTSLRYPGSLNALMAGNRDRRRPDARASTCCGHDDTPCSTSRESALLVDRGSRDRRIRWHSEKVAETLLRTRGHSPGRPSSRERRP